MFDRLDKILSYIGTYLKYFAAILLILVSVLIAIDVIFRSAFNKPIIGVAEVVANGIVIIAFLQLSYTIRIGAMLRSELLLAILPRRPRIWLEGFVNTLGALFFGLLCWASYEPMMRAVASGEFEGHATFQVPTWPVKSIIVICSALAVISYSLSAWRVLSERQPPPGPTVERT